ncbi:NACHT domain-containing protein [Paraburkholderia dipogonis]|uniref:NACHT domain-containing protein n=1 Tax=Paraburkholderia dipogonis TaxID=1211383 RepID=A0ABW9B323_9BURK
MSPSTAKRKTKFDSVRASRDGHEFHEAWVARKCLGLLLPKDDFVGLAIEGFSPADHGTAPDEANEIADAVLYYGTDASFEHARQLVVVQVKYSKAAEDRPFRAADAKKTLEKFAKTYRSYKRQHGAQLAREKLSFELVTNRPILAELSDAILGLRTGTVLQGTARAQAEQVHAACRLRGKDLAEFASRLHMTGLVGDLRENKHRLAVTLADWSPARDPMSRIRLNAIRELARDKANLASQNRNVISRVDVLTALDLQDEVDLLPCPASFAEVGPRVQRRQLTETVARIPLLDRPLMIHADGGVGKTVFMNSIAASLSQEHEVVLFDCFGLGQYRAPGDARHLPRRGLVQIANDLACRGLCDPILPTTDNSDDLIRIFRVRMNQAIETVRRGAPDRQLVLMLDAIDNASEHARDRGEPSFPRLLLESFSQTGPVPGVQLVVSSRSHRRFAARGEASCEEVELEPFSTSETDEFLSRRIEGMTDIRLQVAQSRSRGNARILEHLANEGADLLAPSEVSKVIQLDDLLRKRITDALGAARKHGYREVDIKAFLAGLATLPPPVPVREFAEANGLADGAVNSFAADLAPLLEQTRYGLMFRDEPTETLIREDYSADRNTLHTLARNLLGMQATSVYAATTLPDLLQKLEDGEQLFRLAFDERIPATIKSSVARQAIRHSRIRAAVAHAASRNEPDRLVHLLMELSTLAAVDQRGIEYILDNPDLTVSSGDTDSVRRLFEVRTTWPGTRHARLTIAHVLMGDLADAHRHAQRAIEWRRHYFQMNEEAQREKGQPTALDMASIPFCLVAKGDGEHAARDIAGWVDWFAFDVADALFSLVRIGVSTACVQRDTVRNFLTSSASKAGVLAAAIPFAEGDESLQRWLVSSLATSCQDGEGVSLGEMHHRPETRAIIGGLLRAATVAVVLGMNSEAAAILSAARIAAPSLHTFLDGYWTGEVHAFLAKQVLSCVAAGVMVEYRHLLPSELSDLCVNAPPDSSGQDLKIAMKAELKRNTEGRRTERGGSGKISYESSQLAERFLDSRLDSWLRVSHAFADAIRPRQGAGSGVLSPLLDLWTELRNKRDYYSGGHDAQRQYDAVGERLLTLALSSSPRLDGLEVQRYVKAVSEDGIAPPANLIEIVGILAARDSMQLLAGATAVKVKAAIERENDVDQRASLFAKLAKAISPAGREEAVEYFRTGLEQMDAIGSGDYNFVNELMQFASSLQGDELDEQDSHTLSNICELNLGEERKFHWGMYGAAMAKASGLKGVAKLARWEDRDTISLDYTLLPYLRALLEYDKIDPAIALTMLRVSVPAELYVCGTEQLVESIEGKPSRQLDRLAEELIAQYQQNNPGTFGSGATRSLARLAWSTLGATSAEFAYLSASAERIEVTTDEYNKLSNWRPANPTYHLHKQKAERGAAHALLTALVAQTAPLDELSIANAMDAVEGLSGPMRFQRDFFELLRVKVPFGGWPSYIGMIARLKELDLNDKLHELNACKKAWAKASNAVITALRDSAEIIIHANADEFISFDYLSASQLKALSDLSGVDRQSLILELIKEFLHPDTTVPASVWLGLAAILNLVATSGVGQASLNRLLNSGPAKLASSVVDGPWRTGLYSAGDQVDAAAGLIWFSLGSPHAERRWMGAHSLRTAARLGRPEVLDQVVARFDRKDAAPFQAQEFPFFHLHAQLWLLIALARIALDAPGVVATHRTFLERIALDTDDSHVLRKHFAREALLACVRSGEITLGQPVAEALDGINLSPYPPKSTKSYGGSTFYQSRPKDRPEPEKELHLGIRLRKTRRVKFESIVWTIRMGYRRCDQRLGA